MKPDSYILLSDGSSVFYNIFMYRKIFIAYEIDRDDACSRLRFPLVLSES